MNESEIQYRLSLLDTATISDALDKLNIAGQCLGIKPLAPGFKLSGRAYTIHYTSADQPAGTVGDYIDDVSAGSVVVLDNGGREDATVWGDILTQYSHQKGIAGTVIEGACRDISLSLELSYPIYSRSYSMRTGKDRVQVNAVNVPVNIGAARVSPGDLMIGDSDGVLCIPKKHEVAVFECAERIYQAEEKIRSAIERGARLGDARKSYNYHSLQTKESSV